MRPGVGREGGFGSDSREDLTGERPHHLVPAPNRHSLREVPAPQAHRGGRDGRAVPGGRHRAPAACGPQTDPALPHQRSRVPADVPGRGAHRRAAPPSPHHRDLRARTARGADLPLHGVRGRAGSAKAHGGAPGAAGQPAPDPDRHRNPRPDRRRAGECARGVRGGWQAPRDHPPRRQPPERDGGLRRAGEARRLRDRQGLRRDGAEQAGRHQGQVPLPLAGAARARAPRHPQRSLRLRLDDLRGDDRGQPVPPQHDRSHHLRHQDGGAAAAGRGDGRLSGAPRPDRGPLSAQGAGGPLSAGRGHPVGSGVLPGLARRPGLRRGARRLRAEPHGRGRGAHLPGHRAGGARVLAPHAAARAARLVRGAPERLRGRAGGLRGGRGRADDGRAERGSAAGPEQRVAARGSHRSGHERAAGATQHPGVASGPPAHLGRHRARGAPAPAREPG